MKVVIPTDIDTTCPPGGCILDNGNTSTTGSTTGSSSSSTVAPTLSDLVGGGYKVFYFTRAGCPNCDNIVGDIAFLESNLPLSLTKVSTDTTNGRELAVAAGLSSVPAIVVTRDGQKVSSYVGSGSITNSIDNIIDAAEEALNIVAPTQNDTPGSTEPFPTTTSTSSLLSNKTLTYGLGGLLLWWLVKK